ncbi:hypothetical protein phiCbK_037 [Caulobacter phage phiCbK]|uniref:Uncharacterized protein n=4 Tax=Shapirovirus cbk TaxID=1204537 RepID=J3SVN7_9CAUD|nr:hypothetical protein D865_gp134 [Caulobacter phage phiCbK]AFO71551.1 hypothetical protein phiCbK_037 [Caulobacter phage phiCbK]AFU87116.1 hypothetical protein CbK_gp284 [Caulobacter phage phiCbK]ARB15197.1 hypothetical protein Ccr32_gp279 [Caulobacter phage Ccr32]ARB15531.1 hypothetical protein Ccr34_gp289 [Caulobacter phage Ccr34]
MSRPSIAVVAATPALAPMHWEIVDLKVCDDSRVKLNGDGTMYARAADPTATGWIGFKIVLGCFATFADAYEARNKARSLWFKMGEMVDIAADTVAAAERALAGARAAHALAETAQRAATREPFLGTPTDY